MRSRLEMLRRLASLYGSIEELQSAELQRRSAAVQEAEQALGFQQAVVRSSHIDSRDALVSGDRVNWTTAKLRQEIAEWKQQRLQQVRRERQILSDEAKKQYLASRLQSEQMKHVADHAMAKKEIEEGRRMQAALDDRYLARRRWTDARDDLRAPAEMNKS